MKVVILLALFGLTYAAPQAGIQQQDRRQNPAPFQRDPSENPLRQQPPIRSNTYTRTEEPVQILRFDNINNGDGSYNYGYETENGISVAEEGVVRARSGADLDPITEVKGFYQYFAPEGQKFRVDYTADENGFVPTGDHLPTPPPIPEAIMRSLAILYANAEKQKQLERNDQNRNRF